MEALQLFTSDGQPYRAPSVPTLEDAPDYDFGRAMYGLAKRAADGTPLETVAPLEVEVSRALAAAYSQDDETFLVPRPAKRAPPMDSSSGLYAVQQIVYPDAQALHARSVMLSAGMQLIEGLSVPVSFAVPTDVDPEAVLEDGDATAVEVPPSDRTLEPHAFGVRVPVTRRLNLQSSPALGQYLAGAITDGFAHKFDTVSIEGDATHGILGATGTALGVSVGGNPPTDWTGISGLVEAQLGQGGLGPPPQWVLGAATVAWGVKQGTNPSEAFIQSHGTAGMTLGPYLAQPKGKLADPSVFLLGKWNYLVLGTFGALEIRAEMTAERAPKGGVTYYAWQDADVSPLQVAWVKPIT